MTEETTIFCANCLTPIDQGKKICDNCGRSTDNDPGVEMTESQWLDQPRMPCVNCGKPIIVYAPVCFACGAKNG